VNSRGTPERVRSGQPAIEISVFARYGGSTVSWSDLPPPLKAEPLPMPSDDAVRLDAKEGRTRARPDAGQPDPEDAISAPELGPGKRALQDGELLAEGEVLGKQGDPDLIIPPRLSAFSGVQNRADPFTRYCGLGFRGSPSSTFRSVSVRSA
jgi:hypothetical protein